ncbi:GlsB/YeaQ/YmgE family stress response membrane protein [uncultured Sphingomonas sp.]|uniref:GlsB/YeaQ/YmgE family stress response membrane protein n=1 Tax=uncultured Sphingomonas sp. TaxID=158754 RepID=UPI0035CB18A0
MGLIILLIVGGVIGWLASIVMRTNGQQGIFLNVVVGVVGAVLAGYLISPLLGIAPITSDGRLVGSIPSLLVSFLGAVVLLAIVNLVRRGSIR